MTTTTIAGQREIGAWQAKPGRSSRIVTWAPLAISLLFVALYWPRAIAIADEGLYITQAFAFSRGHVLLPTPDPAGAGIHWTRASTYPPGTSLVQTPFVALFGWRGAYLATLLALVVLFWASVQLLRSQGHRSEFAIAILAYLPVVALSRSAMSDLPNAAFVAVSVLLLFAGGALDGWRRRGAWFTSAFIAVICLLFRDTGPLVLAPFFVGAAVRRDKGWGALLAGGALGVAVVATVRWAVFGSAFFVRDPGYGFSLANAPNNLVVYGVALLLLLPGGLVWPFGYRGARRPETLVSIWVFVAVHATYGYSAHESGGLKQLILAPRYLIPILPLLCLGLAGAAERWWHDRFRWVHAHERTVAIAALFAFGALYAGAQAHLYRREQMQARLISTIAANIPEPSLVLTEPLTSGKYLLPVYGARYVMSLRHAAVEVPSGPPAVTPQFALSLDRSDSEFFRSLAQSTARMMHPILESCSAEEIWKGSFGELGLLRIWRLGMCR